jgi:hypothetical protein
MSASIAGVGGGRRQLADAVGRGVVGPGGGKIRLDTLGSAAQQIVGRRGDQSCRIGLRLELVENVPRIGPGTQIGIIVSNLPATRVVGQRRDVARRVGDLLEVAERLVEVGGDVACASVTDTV